MVQIVGKYEHVSNSADFEAYLKAIETPEQLLKALANSKPTVTIDGSGEQWNFAVSNAGKDSSSSFKFGEPYDEAMPHGIVVKSVTKREGDKFITESSLGDGRSGTRIYEFSDAGITVTLSDPKSGLKATRVYKRV